MRANWQKVGIAIPQSIEKWPMICSGPYYWHSLDFTKMSVSYCVGQGQGTEQEPKESQVLTLASGHVALYGHENIADVIKDFQSGGQFCIIQMHPKSSVSLV